jgi:S-adenosylmethionine decarboxylase
VKLRPKKVKLRGFNNLTKSLSFNIYDVCYAKSRADRKEYLAYLDEAYSSKRLEHILRGVATRIGATILNISSQDYEPLGASVTVLIAEGQLTNEKRGVLSLAHLDKSHLCAHTYPETDKRSGISTFRVDIDIATCGKISPLRALNFLIRSLESEVLQLDYRVRGFTRTVRGRKVFIDHKIRSIQQFIAPKIRKRYHRADLNLAQEHIFHTKMLLRDFALDHYLFGTTPKKLDKGQRRKIKESLTREMAEIFYAKNLVTQ